MKKDTKVIKEAITTHISHAIKIDGYTYALPREIALNNDQCSENTIYHVLLTLLCGEGKKEETDNEEKN